MIGDESERFGPDGDPFPELNDTTDGDGGERDGG